MTALTRFLVALQACYDAEAGGEQAKIDAARMALGVVSWNLAHDLERGLRWLEVEPLVLTSLDD